MPDTRKVIAGKGLKATGGATIAPVGTALPTSLTTELDPAFKSTGFVSDEGLTKAFEENSEKIRDWSGQVVKIIKSEFGVTFQFTVIEVGEPLFLKAMYGNDNVTVTPPTPTAGTQIAIKYNSDSPPSSSYVFETKDGNAKTRQTVPNGVVSEKAEISYVTSDVIKYQVTVDALPDSAGNCAYEYIDDGVFAAA